MFSPFRKKRQAELSGKDTGRYLLYAVSEIALVVVGILVALWINNWSEDQKLKKIEIDILEGIKSDLMQDTTDINFNMNSHRQFARLDSAILVYLSDQGPKNIQITSMLSSAAISNVVIVLRRASFEEAKSRGLSIISNKSLRESISQLYGFHYPFLIEAENSLEMFDNYNLLNSAIIKYFGANKDRVTISNANYNKLLKDENLRFRLLTAKQMSKGILDVAYIPIKEKVLSLIIDIEAELRLLRD